MKQRPSSGGWVGGMWAVAIGCGAALGPGAWAAGGQEPPFQEVLQAIRQHLPGVTEAELNRALVNGLVEGLHPRVLLAGSDGPGKGGEAVPLIGKATVYEGNIGYIRVGQVSEGLAAGFREAWSGLSATNALRGLVLDLRFTGGADYAAAVAVADRFLSEDQALLDWEEGKGRSTVKSDAWMVPVAVLVNGRTEAAAEALAAMLRAAGRGVILGGKTAGHAWAYREVGLSTGQKLRVAVGSVRVGGGEAMPSDGLNPDVEVMVVAGEERAFMADEYRVSGVTAGQRAAAAAGPASRRRVNEAELVRRQRDEPDGTQPRPEAAARPPEGRRVQDPVLARGLDLLKGIALLERAGGR